MASPPSKAAKCLREMQNEIRNQNEDGTCTLAYWRLEDADISKALEEFCTGPDWAKSNNDQDQLATCLAQVQELFSKLNAAMAVQEQSLIWPTTNSNSINAPDDTKGQWSVVFGGKWSANPISISETLVGLLADASTKHSSNARVYTVSRTLNNNSGEESKVVHYAKQHLDDKAVGQEEFQQVMKQVLDDYEKSLNLNDDNNNNTLPEMYPIVFYFTLGQHKGENPFQRNISGAHNFAQALQNIVSFRLGQKSIPWKVVVTGTDATKPSAAEDTVIQIKGINTTVPTYKILTYNFVYAASKLGQLYSIAATVAEITRSTVQPLPSSRKDNDGSLMAIAQQLEAFVLFAGDNGMYRENDILTDVELDRISTHWTNVVEEALRNSLHVATGISICYTPLHRDPWTHASFQNCTEESNGSPKAYMIQQVVRRFKNAISIDRAARSHF